MFCFNQVHKYRVKTTVKVPTSFHCSKYVKALLKTEAASGINLVETLDDWSRASEEGIFHGCGQFRFPERI